MWARRHVSTAYIYSWSMTETGLILCQWRLLQICRSTRVLTQRLMPQIYQSTYVAAYAALYSLCFVTVYGTKECRASGAIQLDLSGQFPCTSQAQCSVSRYCCSLGGTGRPIIKVMQFLAPLDERSKDNEAGLATAVTVSLFCFSACSLYSTYLYLL